MYENPLNMLLSIEVYVSASCPAGGSRQVLTAPGRGSGTGWLYVYHCWVSLLTSRYRPLNAFSTWSMVNEHTAELPEAPLYLEGHWLFQLHNLKTGVSNPIVNKRLYEYYGMFRFNCWRMFYCICTPSPSKQSEFVQWKLYQLYFIKPPNNMYDKWINGQINHQNTLS